jgi:hypothetical protein
MLNHILCMGRSLLFILLVASPALAAWNHHHVPELDPGSMASALTLLIGGFLVLKDRRTGK